MIKVESDFEYKGYRCVTTFTQFGHRCGYVGVPEGHVLYGVSQNDKSNITAKEFWNQPIGKRSPIKTWFVSTLLPSEKINVTDLFNVHGGITFADGGKGSKHPVESDLWWFGFDCGHAGDGKDYELMKQLWPNDRFVQMQIEEELSFGYPVRELDYVQQECRNLVDQIIEYCISDFSTEFKQVLFHDICKSCPKRPSNKESGTCNCILGDTPWL